MYEYECTELYAGEEFGTGGEGGCQTQAEYERECAKEEEYEEREAATRPMWESEKCEAV